MVMQFVRTITISPSESKASLGSKMPKLVSESTITGMDQTNARTGVSIPYSQASDPGTTEEGYFWVDTTNKTLRYYESASGQDAVYAQWEPFGEGGAFRNLTGSTRSANDVAAIASGSPGSEEFYFDGESFTGNIPIGCVRESITNGNSGLVKSFGISTIAVTGVVARGDFLKQNTSSGTYVAVSGGTTLDGTFGIAITANGGGVGTVRAILRGYNKT